MISRLRNFFELLPYLLIQGTHPITERRNQLNKQFSRTQWKADGLKWFSQDGQDEYIAQTVFQGKEKGAFVDIGANDGVTHSNTFALEKHFKWNGICIEPHPGIFPQLAAARSAECINAAAMKEEGRLEFWVVTGDQVDLTMLSGFRQFMTPFQVDRIERNVNAGKAKLEKKSVKAINIQKQLEDFSAQNLDLLCIDVEGAEWFIAKPIFDAGIFPKVVCIENNGMHFKLVYEMDKRGYQLGTILGGDEIYVRRDD